MKGGLRMRSRMTWDQIKKKYPGMWVRLEQVQWESEGSPDVASAVVVKTTKQKPTTQDLKDAMDGICAMEYIEERGAFHTGYITA